MTEVAFGSYNPEELRTVWWLTQLAAPLFFQGVAGGLGSSLLAKAEDSRGQLPSGQ